MLFLVALLCLSVVHGAGELYQTIGPYGVCTDDAKSSPPNYSRQYAGNTSAQCQLDCNAETLCMGYSFCITSSRCALWIDRDASVMGVKLPSNPPNADGWERHVYSDEDPWNLLTSRLTTTETSQVGADKWSCQVRSDVCAAGSINVNGVSVTYTGPRYHTEIFTAACPSGYTGTVGLECLTTVVRYR